MSAAPGPPPARRVAPGPLTADGGLRLETIRQLSFELQTRIDGLARQACEADGVSPFGEHKWLRLIRGDDRCTALLLWRHDGLVAAAHCDVYHTPAPEHPCRLSAELVVHPAHRRRGLGTLLLHGVLALAREEGADELHLWAYGKLPAARTLAERIGCRPARTLLQLELPGERLPELVPALPADLRLRPFEPRRDAYAWLALHNRVFAGHPEQGHWDASDLQARLEQPWFDPADLLLVERAGGGGLVAFCWVKLPRSPELPGEIYIVGVSPTLRGRGLGRVLTEAGLAHMRDRGRPGAMLYVEADNQAALSLYERLGFLQHAEHVCYKKSLTAGAE
jgi:mycothiol synthase